MASPAILAPFSTERGKEWPIERFRELAWLLFDRLGMPSIIVGAPHQRPRANEIVRGLPSLAVVNSCGRTTWADVRDMLTHSHCTIVNNSGIAHLSASLGARTVCIYGGAHDATEWYPRGRNVVIVRKKVICSPCMMLTAYCPNDLACLTEITAEQVFSAILDLDLIMGGVAADGRSVQQATLAELN